MCLTCTYVNPFAGDWLHESASARILNESDLPGGDAADGPADAIELFAGDTFNGSLGVQGDWDWFRVEYEAGVTYTVTLTPGTLTDPFIHIFDATGALVQVVDMAFDRGTETFTFTPETSGSGYLVADSYYNTAEGRDTGFVDTGSYTLSLTLGAPPPLAPSTNPLEAITWNYVAPSAINVYFAPGDVIFDDRVRGQQVTGGWDLVEMQQARLAFATIEAVANVTFNFVTDAAEADFFMVESTDPASAVGYWGVGGGGVTLDSASYDLEGWGVLYNGDEAWTHERIQQGGFGFYALIHEIGHGMGLAHPHDIGGGSRVMNGVTEPFDSLGDFDLNQGINTMMSYNPGWDTAPYGSTTFFAYGFAGTPMAFDIAVLQQKYGANLSTNAGHETYVLPETNGSGTFYTAIWDAGGIDTIRHNGNAAAVIDLKAAPLTYSENGGGFVSHAEGIHGGFTIAAGVVIENAVGGGGNDTITGNDADNRLRGGAGDDSLDGGAGRDRILGEFGDDRLLGQEGHDTLAGGYGLDLLYGGAGDDHLDGGRLADRLFGDSGDDRMLGGGGHDRMRGGAGNDWLDGGNGNDRLQGGIGHDTLMGGAGHDRLWGNAQADVFVFADGHGRDTIEDFDASIGLEKIDLSGISGLSGIADFDAFIGSGALRAVAGGVLVTTGEAMSILLAGVLLDDLDADHFVF